MLFVTLGVFGAAAVFALLALAFASGYKKGRDFGKYYD